MVEAALVDAAARVILDNLRQPDRLPAATPNTTQDVPPPRAPEIVDQAAVDACLRAFAALDDTPPPDLIRDLDDERLWVLLDLARHGTGLGRQRATLELRQALRDLGNQAHDRRALLHDLVRELRQAISGNFPVVFRAFLLEAQAGLQRLAARPEHLAARPEHRG